MRVPAGTALRVIVVGTETPRAVKPLHLMCYTGFLERLQSPVQRYFVQWVGKRRRYFGVGHRSAFFYQQLKYGDTLFCNAQPGAVQYFSDFQKNFPPFRRIKKIWLGLSAVFILYDMIIYTAFSLFPKTFGQNLLFFQY